MLASCLSFSYYFYFCTYHFIIIPAKAFARDYGITGVRLSVVLFVCYLDN